MYLNYKNKYTTQTVIILQKYGKLQNQHHILEPVAPQTTYNLAFKVNILT